MNSGQKLQWLALVAKTLANDRAARLVAQALADRVNSKTGQCNPSVSRIALDSGYHVTNARKALHRLRAAGLLKRAPTFSGNVQTSNHYTLLTPSARASTPPSTGASTPPSKTCTGVLAKRIDRIRKDESPSALTACAAEEGKNINGEHDDDCCVSALGGRTPQSSSETVEKGKRALAEIRANLSADRGKGGRP